MYENCLPGATRAGLELAFDLAVSAGRRGNPPFGAALMTDSGTLIGLAQNTQARDRTAGAHAEINLLRQIEGLPAGEFRDAVLYCSTEPCPNCARSLADSQLRHLVYGCSLASVSHLYGVHAAFNCREILMATGFTTVVGPQMEETGLNLIEGFVR